MNVQCPSNPSDYILKQFFYIINTPFPIAILYNRLKCRDSQNWIRMHHCWLWGFHSVFWYEAPWSFLSWLLHCAVHGNKWQAASRQSGRLLFGPIKPLLTSGNQISSFDHAKL